MNKEIVSMFIMGSNEAQEELMINKSRLNALVREGHIKPFKILNREKLFWKPDVLKLKQELMLDSRTNLAKHLKNV